MKYHYRHVNLKSSIADYIGKERSYIPLLDSNHLIISVQGFGYSGSSAVVDLLREYDVNRVFGGYELEDNPAHSHEVLQKEISLEFDILRHAGGLLELEDIIARGNIFSVDAAIHRFIAFIDYWIKTVNGKTPISSTEFSDITVAFLNSIIDQRIPMRNAVAYNPHLYTSTSETANFIYIAKKLSRNEYQSIAKQYLQNIFSLFESGKNLVLDQFMGDLVLDIDRFEKYVPDFKIVQVYRDPRDVYATATSKSVCWIPTSSVAEYIKWYNRV